MKSLVLNPVIKKTINDTCVDLGPNSLGWYLHCYFFVPSYECISFGLSRGASQQEL